MKRPKFSLRTLLLLCCLAGSGFGLLQNWNGSVFIDSIEAPENQSFAFSPDGRCIVVGYIDGTIKILNVASHKKKQELKG